MTQRRLAAWLPVIGTGCLGWLLWAFAARLNYWEAAQFVSLYYAAAACVVAAHALAFTSRRRGDPPLPAFVVELRGLLSLCVVVIAAWVWASPIAKPAAGWVLRHLAVLPFP